MFRKTMQLAVVVAAMAVCGSAAAAPGKKGLNLTPREVSGVVNINTASAKELELLPGVGPRSASAIVAYREKAPFKAAHEIVRVKGIGEATFRKIKSYLTIAGPTTIVASKGKPATPEGSAKSTKAETAQPTQKLN
ncbi:MAG TPA: ComEA family DNA-binding protein [Myxococcales bacterium]|jgi:competence protein ComEA